MEELQSTDILDREILEDARKKAYRILKTAAETVANRGIKIGVIAIATEAVLV